MSNVPQSPPVTDERAELQLLREQNARLRKELEFERAKPRCHCICACNADTRSAGKAHGE